MNTLISPLRPETIAAKLDAVAQIKNPDLTRQFQEHPRLRELLWFLEWRGRQPGGLGQYLETLIADHLPHLGTPASLALNQPPTTQQLAALHHELSRRYKLNFHTPAFLRAFTEASDAAEDLSQFTKEYFAEGYRQLAHEKIPAAILRFCQEPETLWPEFPWFNRLRQALLDSIEAHAAAAARASAETSVSREIFDAIDYALATRSFVHVSGESRHGKTQAVHTKANMRPGLLRLVTVPASNNDADLYRAVAQALGLEYTHATPGGELKARAEYVLRHSRLGLILDEFHFALPQRYAADTAPSRLNWIRTEIIDRKIPVVAISTPQSFTSGLNKFVRKTGYALEQFMGRKMLDKKLPDTLTQANLLAVAQFHFPEFDTLKLRLIVAKALQSESYLLAVEAIAQRARYLAARDGHATVTLEDLDLAISEVIPTAAPSTRPTPNCAPAAPLAQRRPKPIRAGARENMTEAAPQFGSADGRETPPADLNPSPRSMALQPSTI